MLFGKRSDSRPTLVGLQAETSLTRVTMDAYKGTLFLRGQWLGSLLSIWFVILGLD